MKYTSGTITATGSGSAVSHAPDLSGPDSQGVVTISGTYTSPTLVVEKQMPGSDVWAPVALFNESTYVKNSAAASVTTDTTTSFRFSCGGAESVRAYLSAGSGLSATVHVATGTTAEFGGAFPVLNSTATGSTTTFDSVVVRDSQTVALGTDSDLTMGWDGTDIDVLAAADNTMVTVGASGNAFDFKWFGADANGFFSWDASANDLKFEDNVSVMFGTGAGAGVGNAGDIEIRWDGTDLDVLQTTANSSIKWGVDGAGIDQVWYGDTASTSMTWDQSADSLIFTGAARVVWTGTTGQPEMHLTDNLADALSIGISGSTDLMVFTTTDNAESVAVRGLRKTSTTAVAITGATTLTLADSGGIFTVSQGAAYDVDLPSPTTGPGCEYVFSLTAPGANNVTLTVAGAAATFVGTIVNDVTSVVAATGSTLTFASGASALGDTIVVRSIATNLYHVQAVSSAAGGITIA